MCKLRTRFKEDKPHNMRVIFRRVASRLAIRPSCCHDQRGSFDDASNPLGRPSEHLCPPNCLIWSTQQPPPQLSTKLRQVSWIWNWGFWAGINCHHSCANRPGLHAGRGRCLAGARDRRHHRGAGRLAGARGHRVSIHQEDHPGNRDHKNACRHDQGNRVLSASIHHLSSLQQARLSRYGGRLEVHTQPTEGFRSSADGSRPLIVIGHPHGRV